MSISAAQKGKHSGSGEGNIYAKANEVIVKITGSDQFWAGDVAVALSQRDQRIAVNDKALALVKKLNVTPQDNDTSKALSKQAAEKRAELAKLNGAAFDKAFCANAPRTAWSPLRHDRKFRSKSFTSPTLMRASFMDVTWS